MNRRVVILKYSAELVKELLWIDEKYSITDIWRDRSFSNDGIVNIVIEGNDLPEAGAGEQIPEATMTITTKTVVDKVKLNLL